MPSSRYFHAKCQGSEHPQRGRAAPVVDQLLIWLLYWKSSINSRCWRGTQGQRHQTFKLPLVPWLCVCSLLSRLTLSDPTDCNPVGSSVHETSQARILQWLANPTPGDLSDPGSEPRSPVFPVSAGRFFTTDSPGKPSFAPHSYPNPSTQVDSKINPTWHHFYFYPNVICHYHMSLIIRGKHAIWL